MYSLVSCINLDRVVMHWPAMTLVFNGKLQPTSRVTSWQKYITGDSWLNFCCNNQGEICSWSLPSLLPIHQLWVCDLSCESFCWIPFIVFQHGSASDYEPARTTNGWYSAMSIIRIHQFNRLEDNPRHWNLCWLCSSYYHMRDDDDDDEVTKVTVTVCVNGVKSLWDIWTVL